MKIFKIIKDSLYYLNSSLSLGVHKKEFIKEICFENISRLKIFSIIIIAVNVPFLLIDMNRLSGEMAHHLGSLIVLYARIGLILLTTISFSILSIRKVTDPSDIQFRDRLFLRISFSVLFLLIVMMTLGDELISNSIIVYFGAIFAFALVTTLFSTFSFLLYFTSFITIFITIGFFDLAPQVLLNHRINLSAFTILVWIGSRYIFYLKIKEFINKNERESLIGDLTTALKDVKMLSGLLPICSNCKMIRDDGGKWNNLESYIKDHSDAAFSHSICPGCRNELYNHPEKPKAG